MKKLKLGIIGVGNMGYEHLQNVVDGKCPKIEVTCVADIDPEKLERAKSKLPSVTCFGDAIEMIESGLIEAVVIATPHYFHPTYAIECFKRGIHVMTEKPAGVSAEKVREMNEAADKANVKFGIMFNWRTSPLFIKVREIVKSGQLGEPKRLVWIITNWYRTQHYYNSGSWRATWNGEGGGVLLNQAPHNLDLMQWIFGMPKRVRAFCTCGKYHNIDVEDDATIYAEYENGAVATFITSTGETPGTNRLEISGDLGKIVVEEGKLKWWKLPKSERELCFTEKRGSCIPGITYTEFSDDSSSAGHHIVLERFAEAILEDKELVADGREGLNSLSISNAAYLSSWTDDWAEIPTDDALFQKHLEELCKNEKPREVADTKEVADGSLKDRWKVRW